MQLKYIIGISTLAIISFIGYIIYKKIKEVKILEKLFQSIKIENLELEDLMNWYKQKDNVNILKENMSSIAIVLRDNEIKNMIKQPIKDEPPYKILVQAIFDKTKNEIICGRIIYYKNISDDIIELFKGKEMIIVQ